MRGGLVLQDINASLMPEQELYEIINITVKSSIKN
jgi:hypothetical protein